VTTDAEIDAAIARAKAYEPYRPRAIAARYRAKDDTIAVKLASGVELTIPRRLLQGLQDADPRDVARVEIDDEGSALRWEALDLDHSVPGLIDGILGTRKWMAAIGAIGGATRSTAKRVAAQRNGRRGGRPRRS